MYPKPKQQLLATALPLVSATGALINLKLHRIHLASSKKNQNAFCNRIERESKIQIPMSKSVQYMMWAFLRKGRMDSLKFERQCIQCILQNQLPRWLSRPSHGRGTEDSAMNQSAGAWRSETSPCRRSSFFAPFRPKNQPMNDDMCVDYVEISWDVYRMSRCPQRPSKTIKDHQRSMFAMNGHSFDGTHCHVDSLLAAWCCHCALIFFSKVASKCPLSLALLDMTKQIKFRVICGLAIWWSHLPSCSHSCRRVESPVFNWNWSWVICQRHRLIPKNSRALPTCHGVYSEADPESTKGPVVGHLGHLVKQAG